MNVISSSAATALAGPGPQTWLYRFNLALRVSSRVGNVPSSQFQQFATSPSSLKSLRPKVPRSNRSPIDNQPRAQPRPQPQPQPQRNARRSTPPRTVTVTSPSTGSPVYENVIYLRVPPNYPIDKEVEELHKGIEANSVKLTLRAWGQLHDLGCTHRLSDKEFSLASKFTRDSLVSPPFLHLSRFAVSKPVEFGYLRLMAIECAARGHTDGLNAFMLKLMEVGRPKDVVDAFTACKERMRDVQGKDAGDLVSWDREKRLAARLEGPGLKDLMIANIAALTLLNSCDGHALFQMLDSHVDLRPNSYFNFAPIHRAYRIAKAGEEMYDKFRQNVDKLVLSIMCYHPNALSSRINMLGANKSYGKVEQLYERVLQGSTGPDAFIRPRDLTDFGSVYRNIPLPPMIWLAFIKVFEWRSDVDRIARMIDHDLPARGLRPDAHFLSSAMLHMSIIYNRPSQPASVQSKARAWADEYWRRLTSEGWHTEDGAFSRRIRMLGVLSWNDPRHRGEVRRLYDAAKAGHLGRVGPKTRAAFVEFFMMNRKVDAAFKVFQTFPLDSDPATRDTLDPAFSTFIRRLSLGYWTGAEKLKWCNRALRIFIGSGNTVRSLTLGPLLAIQLEGGLPMAKTVDTVLDSTIDDDAPQAGITRWTTVIQGLLTKWTHTKSPSILELDAALLILLRASRTQLFGVTRGRVVAMWMAFLVPAAKSTWTDASKRQDLIDSALQLFPGGKREVSLSMYMDIIGALFARSDGNGFAEGWRRWNDARSSRDVPGLWYDRMLSLLMQHNKMDFAPDLIRQAWDDKTVPRTEGFWLRVQAAGLTRQLGIERELEVEQAYAVQQGGVRQRPFRDTLAYASDLATEESGADEEVTEGEESGESDDAEDRWELREEDEEEVLLGWDGDKD